MHHKEFGIEIISTGGTADLLTKEGVPVTLVEELTGFGAMLDGRVKTLHPAITRADDDSTNQSSNDDFNNGANHGDSND